MKLGLVATVGLLAILASTMIAPTVAAKTYYGPEFKLPTSISPGGAINIVLTTGSGTSVVPLPQGSGAKCSGTCGPYPQLSWTVPTGCFYSVHEVTVADPNGNGYMLGSAHTSGLFWPHSLGGPSEVGPGKTPGSTSTAPYPPADALNVTVGDTFTIPFASGVGGFSFTSVLGNPPNDVTPAGPYYWWTLSGNTVYGGHVRIDTMPTVNPTLIHATPTHPYVVDIEGVVACPTTAGGTTTTPFSSKLFFDNGVIVTTPQFPISFALVAVSGLAALLLVRKKLGFQIP